MTDHRTADRLARVLREAGAPSHMVSRAVDGYYDDFQSPLVMPIHALVQDARAAGLEDIARRAINGEFDASREEAQSWLREQGL